MLQRLAGDFVSRLAAGGALVLSGMLADLHAEEVTAAYEALGCRRTASRMEGEWEALLLEGPAAGAGQPWHGLRTRPRTSRSTGSRFAYCRVTQGGAAMGETLTVRLPAKLRGELERVARYLAVRRFRALRAGVPPFAEAQGILTYEDVFKALS